MLAISFKPKGTEEISACDLTSVILMVPSMTCEGHDNYIQQQLIAEAFGSKRWMYLLGMRISEERGDLMNQWNNRRVLKIGIYQIGKKNGEE